MPTRAAIERVLDRARWAPSGDNTQPWRFGILSEDHAVVYGSDTRRTVVYDLRGHASQIAIGALLEYISISATGERLVARIARRRHDSSNCEDDEKPIFDIYFSKDPALLPDPLSSFLERRCVNRRPFGTRPLSEKEKKLLEGLLPSGFNLVWFEGLKKKLAMANLTQRAGKLRLSIPEAYTVHREIIEWNARTSIDRVPDLALGLSSNILPMMRWIMGKWSRVLFFNRFLGGTLIPRVQLDILPALFCSAHFLLLAENIPNSLDDYVAGGRALARLWLGCASMDLQFQPEMTPLIFRSYATENIVFSNSAGAMGAAHRLQDMLDHLAGEMVNRAIFLGRIGRGSLPEARSLRKPLSLLLAHEEKIS